MKKAVLSKLPENRYLSLRTAARYTSLSVRLLRSQLRDPDHPLPHFRVGAKILLRRSELDAWMARYRRVGRPDLDAIAEEICRSLAQSPNHMFGGKARESAAGKRRQMKAENGCSGGAS